MAKHLIANHNYKELLKLFHELSNNRIQQAFEHDSSSSFDEFLFYLAWGVQEWLRKLFSRMLFFYLMSDEGTDAAGRCFLCLMARLVNDDLKIVNVFLGLKFLGSAGSTTPNLRSQIDKIVVEKWKFFWMHCLGGTGDGAPNVQAVWSGLRKQQRWVLSRHCGDHRLELASSAALAKIPELTKVKKQAHAIIALVRAHGKRKAIFIEIQKEEKLFFSFFCSFHFFLLLRLIHLVYLTVVSEPPVH
jgi:hypothetical protein